jgi:hypothetical protein
VEDASSRVETAPAAPLRFEPQLLAAGFSAHPVPLQHDLAGAPGFTVADVVALVGRLPLATMEATPARVPLLTPGGVPALAVDPELARTIDTADARFGLLGLQDIEPYRGVLHACLGQVYGVVGMPDGPPQRDETSIFLAAPGATVPVHFDSHHNVLLQLVGTKELSIGQFPDPDAQTRALEIGCRSRTRTGHVLPPETARFELRPGDGIYIPPYTFHWVHGGTEVSAALSCSFSTAATHRAEVVHACNAQLRRLGLRPRPPGRSVGRDRLKVAGLRAARRARFHRP